MMRELCNCPATHLSWISQPSCCPSWLLSTAPCLPAPTPQVCIQGTYILPGIPRLFQQMVEAHADRFRGPAAYSSTLFTNLGEGEAAAELLAGCMVEEWVEYTWGLGCMSSTIAHTGPVGGRSL